MEMRIKVPSISDNEAIEAFITGLRFHDALRDKLLLKRPESVTALLATAQKYADADDAKKIIIREAARVPRSDHPPHHDDYQWCLDLGPFRDEVSQHLGLDRCSGGICDALIHQLECPLCGSSCGVLAMDDLAEGERRHDRHRV